MQYGTSFSHDEIGPLLDFVANHIPIHVATTNKEKSIIPVKFTYLTSSAYGESSVILWIFTNSLKIVQGFLQAESLGPEKWS